MMLKSILRSIFSPTLAALLVVGCCTKNNDSGTSSASASGETESVNLDRPENWERRVHNDKGFLFYVPKGTEEQEQSEGTTFLYLAKMPAPHDKISLIIGAVKERQFGNQELKELSKVLVKSKDKATDFTFDSEEKLNASFTVANGHYTKDGSKHKARELLALDVNDRYIVLLTAPEADFDRHEDDIDKVLANFEMFRSGKGSAGDDAPKSMPRKPASGSSARAGGNAASNAGASAALCPECAQADKEGADTRCSDGVWRKCRHGKGTDVCPGGGTYDMVPGTCYYPCAQVPQHCPSGKCKADRKTCYDD
jgi:hypothetical protein